MTDGHYPHYQEMLDKVDWTKYGVVDGVARDSRCENCMVHCGYDPSGALGTNYKRGDNWKNFKYNFWPRPAPYPDSSKIAAFNGFSIGKGHMAEAKATVKAALKDPAPQNASNGTNSGGCCSGNGESSERAQLLARVQGQNRSAT
jgi:hypothetical protein